MLWWRNGCNFTHWPRLGGQRLTDSHGAPTPAGRIYQGIARERGLDDSLDPWTRGTQRIPSALYTRRRSGKEQVVARFHGGELLPTKGAGEQYYGAFREEYMIEVPVYSNSVIGSTAHSNTFRR